METGLWVNADRVRSATAIDDLLADSVSWNIRDLVVQIDDRPGLPDAVGRAPFDGDGLDPLGHLVRGAALVGVRVHAWSDLDAVVCADIARRYPIEGLQFDRLRRPRGRGATSSVELSAVTALVADAGALLRAVRPGIVLSVAVPGPDHGAGDLQRWPEWLANGLIDRACALAYDPDPTRVAMLLAPMRAAAGDGQLWAGLMGYDGPSALIRTQVRAARDAGCDGVILFAYDPARRDLIDAFAAAAA